MYFAYLILFCMVFYSLRLLCYIILYCDLTATDTVLNNDIIVYERVFLSTFNYVGVNLQLLSTDINIIIIIIIPQSW